MSKSGRRLEFHIIAMATYGRGLSGGDRIFIETFKRIGESFPVYIYAWEEGLAICKREGFKSAKYILWSSRFWSRLGFFINYFARVVIASFNSLRIELDNSSDIVIYSSSEFWQDTFPAAILKLRYPKTRWIATWYQTAPHPFKGFREGGRVKLLPNLRAFLYWFVQKPIKPLIQKYADFVFVTSEPDRSNFPTQNKKGEVYVIKGGVDIEKAKRFINKFRKLPKIYDAVFQGRFHPQKGVVEMIETWKLVVEKKKNANLAMIGDGPLMEDVQSKIISEGLDKNVKLFGYVFDGPEKSKIFCQSKMVVHPSLYDSGGMAAAEAMVFGIPCIGFDLKSYKTYYPQGMIRVKKGNKKAFANAVLKFLSNERFRKSIGKEAQEMIYSRWSWNARAQDVVTLVTNKNFYL